MVYQNDIVKQTNEMLRFFKQKVTMLGYTQIGLFFLLIIIIIGISIIFLIK